MADQYPIDLQGDVAKIELKGRLDATGAPVLSESLKTLTDKNVKKIVFTVNELEYISSAGLRAIVFAKQKIGTDVQVFVIGASADIVDVIKMTGFDSFLTIQDTYEG